MATFVDLWRNILARRASPSGLAPFVEAFPVGSVYISFVSTDPGTLLGYGTWTAIAGRFLVGVDALDSDFTPVLKTGGTKIITFPDPTAEIEAAADEVEDLATMIAGQ